MKAQGGAQRIDRSHLQGSSETTHLADSCGYPATLPCPACANDEIPREYFPRLVAVDRLRFIAVWPPRSLVGRPRLMGFPRD